MNMKRLMDLVGASLVLLIALLPMLIIAVLIKLTSQGPVIHWSCRVGMNNRVFRMPKFRTMCLDTPAVATHLLKYPATYLTPVGSFLRKTSLDELPQLWSIIKGDMTLVGPRPALFNQIDLIELRTRYGIDKLIPGLTGWAQINGRDELPIPVKVSFDVEYKKRHSCCFDLYIIWCTLLKVISREGVSH